MHASVARHEMSDTSHITQWFIEHFERTICVSGVDITEEMRPRCNGTLTLLRSILSFICVLAWLQSLWQMGKCDPTNSSNAAVRHYLRMITERLTLTNGKMRSNKPRINVPVLTQLSTAHSITRLVLFFWALSKWVALWTSGLSSIFSAFLPLSPSWLSTSGISFSLDWQTQGWRLQGFKRKTSL